MSFETSIWEKVSEAPYYWLLGAANTWVHAVIALPTYSTGEKELQVEVKPFEIDLQPWSNSV